MVRWSVLLLAVIASLVVFCVVQDRVTAAGARQYVRLQRDAAAAGRPPVAVDAVMRPAILDSVWRGALWGGTVLVAGLAAGAVTRPRRRT